MRKPRNKQKIKLIKIFKKNLNLIIINLRENTKKFLEITKMH